MVTPRRKNSRLPGYDYSEVGNYFVTIVSHHRQPLFGEVVDGEMVLSEFGRIVEYTWHDLVNHNPDIGLDEFVIKPNHIHGIIVIFPPKTGSIVGACSQPAPKAQTAKPGAGFPMTPRTRQGAKNAEPGAGFPMTQRTRQGAKNAHIISTEREYEQIAAYIANNPLNWMTDEEHQ